MSDLRKLRDEFVDRMAVSESEKSLDSYCEDSGQYRAIRAARALLAALDAKPEPPKSYSREEYPTRSPEQVMLHPPEPPKPAERTSRMT